MPGEAVDGCPIPGSIPSQAGWGPEEPGLEESVPARGRGVEGDDPERPIQPKPFSVS